MQTVSLSEDGHEQVSGYHMRGEIIGTDGIGTDAHGCRAVALEDTEVCTLSLDRIEALGRENVGFQHSFHRLLAQEISRERTVRLLLGMHADQRLAIFLLDLSQRYEARGYSASEFVLRMTRDEIGSYLGLKLETVSRLFSRFQRGGLVPGTRREIAGPSLAGRMIAYDSAPAATLFWSALSGRAMARARPDLA